MALTTWLIDKSAYVRLGSSPDTALWAERISQGLVFISSVSVLEIGYSFRNHAEATREFASPPLSAMPVEFIDVPTQRLAQELQLSLCADSHHRGVSIPDLLIAASAFRAGHTVLHVDADFDLIARYTKQSVERLPTSQ